MATLLLRLMLAIAVLPVLAAAAAAHAVLVASEPADGAALASPPARIVLRFNEPVSPLGAGFRAPGAAPVDLALEPMPDGSLSAPLPDGGGAGTRVVSWRAVSADGHPVSGSVVYAVGGAPRTAGIEAAGTGAVEAALSAARLALHAAVFFGAGGAVFAAWFARGRPGRWTVAATAAGLPLVPAVAGLAGLAASGGRFADLATAGPWEAARVAGAVPVAAFAAAALLLGLAAARTEGPAARVLAVLAALAAGGMLACAGHAATAEPAVLARTALVLHGAALAVWLGALPPLAARLGGAGDGVRGALARFSAAAPAAVAALAAGGVLLAALQTTAPADLVATAYGRVLLVKLLLVLGLLALAAANRRWWTAPTLAGDPAATRRLRASVRAEIGLALAILAVAGLWRFTPPPRALAAPVSVHLHGRGAAAEVTLSPGRAGPVRIVVVPLADDLGPLRPMSVAVALAHPDAGIEPIRRDAAPGPDGGFVVDGLSLPVPGRWRMTVTVLIDDFTAARLEGDVTVRP